MESNDGDSADDPARSTVRSVGDTVRRGMGRRAFLALVAAGGVGSGLAAWHSADGDRPADRDEASIVYGVARTDSADPRSVEPLRKTVPDEWLRELSRALDVHRQLRLRELSGFLGSYVVPGDRSDPAASLSIHATADGIEEAVADLSPGVDFEVDVFGDLPDPTGGSAPVEPAVLASLDQPSVPGGVFCGSGSSNGSLAPAVFDPRTGRRFFLTANHLYGGSGLDHRGESLYLSDGSARSTIGRVRRGFSGLDVVLADPIPGRTPASEIADATPAAVGGQFTKLGLADLQARGEPLEMTGAVSGHTSGPIKGIDGVTFYTGEGVRTGQLIWGDESMFTDGDSGSVNYHVDPLDDDRVLVGGLNSARTWWPGANFTWGTAAYRIRAAHGLVF